MADLYEKISHEISAAKKFAPETIEIPKYILNNLKYAPYSWQTNALECLIYYENEKSGLKKNPSHLMFFQPVAIVTKPQSGRKRRVKSNLLFSSVY